MAQDVASRLDLKGLSTEVQNRVFPLLAEVLEGEGDNVHSLYVVGAAASGGHYVAGGEINTLILLKDLDFQFVKKLAPSGKVHGKRRLAPPIVLPDAFVRESSYAFPVEFLNYKYAHKTVYGEDILAGVEIDNRALRQQCERELATRLITLRQEYLYSRGEAGALGGRCLAWSRPYMPVLRAVLHLLGADAAETGDYEVLEKISALTGADFMVFAHKEEKEKSPLRFLKAAAHHKSFEKIYEVTERLSHLVNEIKV